ncbi:MAG: peptide chain release factor N(5)-glutamine methyltransferase [Actinomycetota bacterium]|jgi:release factor glutamine methyltransferase
MKLVEALAFATDQLTLAGVKSAQADATWLLCHALQTNRSDLLTRMTFDFGFTDEQLSIFNSALERRVRREPLQHITGLAAFRSLELEVGPGVFIPRPETEQVVQYAIDYLRQMPGPGRAIDLGTGSGAIAIAMATEVPETMVFAVELSEAAHAYAARNIAKLAPSIQLRLGAMQEQVSDLVGSLDVVISNPPYIPEEAVPIDPEVRDYDPELALYGGVDGLDVIRDISGIAAALLRPGGLLVLEHADGQSEAIRDLLLESGWLNVSAFQDATLRYRTITALR